ncbi:MAG: TolC family protein [Nitrospirae bacterium]|nr:TolC family protein [Nitrospirota bacterium]
MKLLFSVMVFIFAFFFIEDIYAWGSEQGQEEEVIYLSLPEVIQRTINNNLDVKLARFDASIKKTDLPFRKAIFDPILKGGVDYADDRSKRSSTLLGTENTRADYNLGLSKKLSRGTEIDLDFSNTRESTDSSFAAFNPSYESTLKLSLTQPLGKNRGGLIDRGGIEITKLDIKNADSASLDRIETAIADTEKAYWNLVLAYRELKIKEGMLKWAKELFNLNKERIKTGLVEETDIYASEANLRLRQLGLLIAKNEVQSAIKRLKLLMNDSTPARIMPRNKLKMEKEDILLEPKLREAFAHRRDYQRVKNDIKAKNIRLDMKANSRWPQIDLVGSLARNGLDARYGTAVDDIFGENNPTYFVGIKFSLPLGNRKAKSEYDRAALEKARSLVDMQKIERIIVTEVDERVRAVKVNQERAGQQLEVEKLQRLKLGEEEKKFKQGRSGSDILIRFQEDLLKAEIAAVESLVDYRKSLVDLERTQNTLLSKWGIN